jgi:hypothetical protein
MKRCNNETIEDEFEIKYNINTLKQMVHIHENRGYIYVKIEGTYM